MVVLGGGVRAETPTEEGEEKAAAAQMEATRERREDMRLYLQGRYLFQKQCVPCHGRTGRGNGPWAEGLTDPPRDLRSGVFKFRSTPRGKLPTDEDLRRTLLRGVSGTAMPSFQSLPEADLEAVMAYVQNLSRRWSAEEYYAAPIEIPEVPQWFAGLDADSERVQSGKALFAQMCAACHGAEGFGDGPGSQGLADTWGHAIKPAVLAAAHHKSGNQPTDLYRAIATGLDGTPMNGYAEVLKAEQIWQLVAWIKRIEGTAQSF